MHSFLGNVIQAVYALLLFSFWRLGKTEPQIAGLDLCGNYFGLFNRSVTGEYSGRLNLVVILVTMVCSLDFPRQMQDCRVFASWTPIQLLYASDHKTTPCRTEVVKNIPTPHPKLTKLRQQKASKMT